MPHMHSHNVGGPSGPKNDIYLESWDANWKSVLDKMPINSNTVVDIGFAKADFAPNGTPLGLGTANPPMTPEQADAFLKAVIQEVHAKGGQVKMSFGGETYPFFDSSYAKNNDAKGLADKLTTFMSSYKLDGVDFDMEGPTPSASQTSFATSMLSDLRSSNPNADISLTIPGQGWNSNWATLATNSAPSVSRINFMEYPLWIGNDASGKKLSYVDQIKWDINYYIQNFKIPPDKIQIGIRPGDDASSNHYNLSLSDAQAVANFAKDNGLAGVAIWDAELDNSGVDGNASFAYLQSVENILSSSDRQDPYNISATSKKRTKSHRLPADAPTETIDPNKELKSKPRGLFDIQNDNQNKNS